MTPAQEKYLRKTATEGETGEGRVMTNEEKSLCLAQDPFAGDFEGSGQGDKVLKDKMVTNRKGGKCHDCQGECLNGTTNRVRVEVYDGEMMTFRWCEACCVKLAHWADSDSGDSGDGS